MRTEIPPQEVQGSRSPTTTFRSSIRRRPPSVPAKLRGHRGARRHQQWHRQRYRCWTPDLVGGRDSDDDDGAPTSFGRGSSRHAGPARRDASASRARARNQSIRIYNGRGRQRWEFVYDAPTNAEGRRGRAVGRPGPEDRGKPGVGGRPGGPEDIPGSGSAESQVTGRQPGGAGSRCRAVARSVGAFPPVQETTSRARHFRPSPSSVIGPIPLPSFQPSAARDRDRSSRPRRRAIARVHETLARGPHESAVPRRRAWRRSGSTGNPIDREPTDRSGGGPPASRAMRVHPGPPGRTRR